MYAITGATGHIGRKIAERLLDDGRQVRAIGRDRGKLLVLEQKGAEIWACDLRDADCLTRAFAVTDGAFTMIPPAFDVPILREYQNQVGEGVAEAIQRSGVTFVVNLSSLGAHLDKGTGPVLGLHDQEERLNRLDAVNVLHLQPTFFMENVLAAIPVIRSRGILGTALRGDVRFPVIATRDIADYAYERLLNRDFSGKRVRMLLGERDVTMNEFTRVLGQAIGHPELPYVQFSYEAAAESLMEIGAKEDAARSMMELMRGINEERLLVGTPRSVEATTPTSIEEFAADFAAAFSAAHEKAA